MEQEKSLTEIMKDFAQRRAIIILEKKECVKAQHYERAAVVRDREKKLEEDAIAFLKNEGKYELSDSQQMIADIWMVFDLVQPGETTFENAVQRITPVNLQRIAIIKKVEEYKNGVITLDDLHQQIKKSFKVVREDIKNTILKLE